MSRSLKVLPEEKPWYADGLRFQCTECGQCCTGAPGYTWVSEEEIATIAYHLNLSLKEFSKRYLRRVMGRQALLELPRTYDCIFLKDKKCQIYSVRPKQCRTFPWWRQNLSSPEAWEEAAKHCEGINPMAPLVPGEVIQEQLDLQEKKEA
jgi:uncharacterized protein